jgi:hypothetical protein
LDRSRPAPAHRGYGFARRPAVLALLLLGLAALLVDPDPRGPLTHAANAWQQDTDDVAAEWFARAVPRLRGLGVDPATLVLPTEPFDSHGALAVIAWPEPSGDARLRVALDRLARDDAAKAILGALHLARTGRREEARERLAPHTARSARIAALHAALADAEIPPDVRLDEAVAIASGEESSSLPPAAAPIAREPAPVAGSRSAARIEGRVVVRDHGVEHASADGVARVRAVVADRIDELDVPIEDGRFAFDAPLGARSLRFVILVLDGRRAAVDDPWPIRLPIDAPLELTSTWLPAAVPTALPGPTEGDLRVVVEGPPLPEGTPWRLRADVGLVAEPDRFVEIEPRGENAATFRELPAKSVRVALERVRRGGAPLEVAAARVGVVAGRESTLTLVPAAADLVPLVALDGIVQLPPAWTTRASQPPRLAYLRSDGGFRGMSLREFDGVPLERIAEGSDTYRFRVDDLLPGPYGLFVAPPGLFVAVDVRSDPTHVGVTVPAPGELVIHIEERGAGACPQIDAPTCWGIPAASTLAPSYRFEPDVIRDPGTSTFRLVAPTGTLGLRVTHVDFVELETRIEVPPGRSEHRIVLERAPRVDVHVESTSKMRR